MTFVQKVKLFGRPSCLGFLLPIGEDRTDDLRRYFKRRDNLFLLYGGDVHAANFAFDYVLDQNVDTIYWFADFIDNIDKEIVEDLTRRLKRNRVKVIAHNFLGRPVRKEAKQTVEEVGGKTLEVVPGKQ